METPQVALYCPNDAKNGAKYPYYFDEEENFNCTNDVEQWPLNSEL